MHLAAAVALLVLGAPLALAGTRCLGYLDEDDSWHPGFSCPAFTFCCGTCHHRFCCRDLSLRISEWRQRRCLGLSPRIQAAVACAGVLFVAVVAAATCCCLGACHHLYRRRQQLQSPFGARPPWAPPQPSCPGA